MIMDKLKAWTKELLQSTNAKLSDFFVILMCGFIAGNIYTVSACEFDNIKTLMLMSPAVFFTLFTLCSLCILVAFILMRDKRVINWSFLTLALVFGVALVINRPDAIWFNMGIAFVLVFIVKYVTRDDGLGLEDGDISPQLSLCFTTAVFIIFAVSVSVFTIIKYATFSHSAFDFGIFCQMFEQMAKTGLPVTTVERGGALSHFAVHFSPVYYLLLPGYMIFRHPVYLLVMQAVIVGLSVFPIRKICMEMGFSNKPSFAASLIFALFPTMANGCFYDFHENKFLSLFILWMIYFALKNNRIGTGVFALLTLSVKEDAAIYVIAIAIWMLLTKRDRIFAVIIIGLSVVYFIFACKMIALSGGEIMMSRLDKYYVYPNGGFAEVIKNCFYDIGYLIDQVFNGADISSTQIGYSGQKMEFILWTFIPLLFMPLASKHTTHLVLFIPLLVINLMPDWIYQHDIDYQYTYGTCALVLAAAFLALSERTKRQQMRIAVAMVAVCTVFTVSAVFPKGDRYYTWYKDEKENYALTADALNSVPRDASVTAYGFFIPHLYDVDDLQTIPKYYGGYEKTDYVILDIRYSGGSVDAVYEMMGDDYTLISEKGYTLIYKLND